MKRLATWLLGCVVLMCMAACEDPNNEYDDEYWTLVSRHWEEVQCNGKTATHPRSFDIDRGMGTMRLRFPYMPDAKGEMEYLTVRFTTTEYPDGRLGIRSEENDFYGALFVHNVDANSISFLMTVHRKYANTKWDEFEFVCKLKKD